MTLPSGAQQSIKVFEYKVLSGKKKHKMEEEEYQDHEWYHFGRFCEFLKNINPQTNISFQLSIYLPFIHLYPLKVRHLSIILDSSPNLVLDDKVDITPDNLILKYHYVCTPTKSSTSNPVSSIFKQVNDIYFHNPK